jgi:hypothetical protein
MCCVVGFESWEIVRLRILCQGYVLCCVVLVLNVGRYMSYYQGVNALVVVLYVQ